MHQLGSDLAHWKAPVLNWKNFHQTAMKSQFSADKLIGDAEISSCETVLLPFRKPLQCDN
jgi:hypothetical protein